MDRKEAIEIVRKNYPHVGFSGSEFETALRELVPEFKEQPDPRHSLIEFIKWSCDRGCITPEQRKNIDFWLAYLEKQKDSLYRDKIDQHNKEILDGTYKMLEHLYECSKSLKHKPIQDGIEKDSKVVEFDHDKEQKHKIARWKPLGECSDIPDGHYVVGWFHFGDFRLGIMCKGLFVDPNGNRAEQPKEVFYIPNADEDFIYAEQKNAEWSEENEKHLYNAIEAVKYTYDVSADSGGAQCIEFLKSLPKRFNLPPKQEWSEEDRDKVAQYLHDKDGGMLWSKATEITRDILDMLRPLPHWKPSKEQMNALKVVARGFPTDDPDAIDSLLTDLQKLL